jgi:outer membrane protein TolC
MRNRLLILILLASALTAGCQTPITLLSGGRGPGNTCPLLDADYSASAHREINTLREVPDTASKATLSAVNSPQKQTSANAIQLASWRATSDSETLETPVTNRTDEPSALQLPIEAGDKSSDSVTDKLHLRDVISSVLSTYPLVQAAALQFEIAQGQVQSADGAFDLKLKGASENGPLGFYESYRHSVGAVQPLANGGEVFGGYRIGRGVFQPWYQERQTNEGGEFKAGLSVPLSRNAGIDTRRAEVRKAGIDLAAADPQFRGEVIYTVQGATEAYWQWVAASARQRIAEQVLVLATTRNEGLKEEVRMGAKALPVLKDNRGSILSREAKLIDAQRKVTQSAAKLSIYVRTTTGESRIPSENEVPAAFPDPQAPDAELPSRLSQQAIQSRPELRDLDLTIERIDVEIGEAGNDLLPNVDAIIVGSQDMGEPTSRKRDKSEFELEAALVLDVPLQRRKARGKITSLEAKRAQLAQKRRLSEDKVRTEIAIACAAIKAAYERIQRTAEARELAEYMAEVEREKFAAGESNLLSVALREEKSAEAAGIAIDALLEYQIGLASLRAAAGVDDGNIVEWKP